MTLDDKQAQQVLKANLKTPTFITESREQSNTLFALLHGDEFIDTLIEKIEYIESPNKALARKKYSRDVVHVFDRLLRPVSNVYSANGGSIHLDVSEEQSKELLSKMSRDRDGKSLNEWLKTFWMPLYHSDPNGVIFLEYETVDNKIDCWPTYKQVDVIRNYEAVGQLVEWIQFEPKKETINGKPEQTVRLVDDKMDRTYLIKGGDQFVLLTEVDDKLRTFEHPFGQTPAIINSDIESLRGSNHRLSPIRAIVPIAEEYARDQSVKTLYKLRMGLPIEWKLSDQCITCQGSGKQDGNQCKECDGHGYYMGKDIVDVKLIAAPEGDEPAINGNDTGGFIVPPAEVLREFREELASLDRDAHRTHWGTMAGFVSTVQKTATEVFLDTQPMNDKLNDYGDVAEFMLNQIVNWYAFALFKKEGISSITLGRRYIIESPDVILDKYEKAKEQGDNNVILDRLYGEYQASKYKRDPEFLRVQILKSKLEPYLHLKLEQVQTIFGVTETKRKVLFQDWWSTLDSASKEKKADVLTKEFDKWFEDKTKDQEPPPTTGGGE